MSRLPFPSPFLDRLAALVPPDRYEPTLRALVEPKRVGFRVNRLRADRAEAEEALRREGVEFAPVPWLPDAYTAPPEHRERLVRSPLFSAGHIYLQNLSSMAAVHVLDPQPDEEVLDLAAAPGGKTLLMAQRMENRGRIAAVEVIRERLYKMQSVLKTGGAANVRTYLADGRTIGRKTPERFDRVLLDAPCSGESRFHVADPASFARWSPRKIAECSRKQIGLLRSAAAAAKVGGIILYCTCSFAPEENEAVVDAVLRGWGDAMQTEPISLPLENLQPGLTCWGGHEFHPAVASAVRILPTPEMDGFFLCRLRKTASF
ncbi:MAG: RsmB/NOP family class I SAM-dependent RNA methyltransferase [Thermogutta sp.]|nr:RsmB/NOP family class I SAM-dependent RNA methyltransferase [Thermogutta sp.]